LFSWAGAAPAHSRAGAGLAYFARTPVIHGENDLYVRPSSVREFVERTRAGSVAPVEYTELPGAHHDFDLYESIRSAAINVAVESFIARA